MNNVIDSISEAEVRTHPRVALDMPFFVTVSLEGASHSALLANCSQGGIQIVFAPGKGTASQFLGKMTRITGLPGIMDPGNNGCMGMALWATGDRCGIRFLTPLDVSDEQLAAFLRNL